MGSDLFSVSVEKYKELKTKDAIKSAILAGEHTEQVYYFFNSINEEIWVEVTLFINTIHPDVCIEFDELFFTRVLEEGVTAWDNPNSIDYDKTPFSNLYKELWKSPKEFEPVIFVSTIKYYGIKKKNKIIEDDSVEVTVFVPLKYVPNIKGVDSWNSRAWGGVNPGYSYGLEVTNKPKKMIVKKMDRDVFISYDDKLDKRLFKFNKENKKWSDEKIIILNKPIDRINQISIYDNLPFLSGFYSPEQSYSIDENYNHIEIFLDKKKKPIVFTDLVIDDKGAKWFATPKGVLFQFEDKEKLYKKKDGLHSNKIDKIFLLNNNRILAYNKSKLSVFEDSEWKSIDNYTLKKIEQITVDEEFNIWCVNGKIVEVITPKGDIKKFPKAKWPYAPYLKPFKGSKVLAETFDSIVLLDLKSLEIKNIVVFKDVNEQSISPIAKDSKGNIWALSQGNLILFRDNEIPVYFIFEDSLPYSLIHRYDKLPYDSFVISENGDIWILKNKQGVIKINSETIDTAINSEILNTVTEDFFIFSYSKELKKKTKEKLKKKTKTLNKAQLIKLFPESNLKGSNFTSNSELTKSLCESGVLESKEVKDILSNHLKALENFNGGAWQTLDVSGMVMAIMSSAPEDLAKFSNKKILKKIKLKDKNLKYANFCSAMAEEVDFTKSNLESAIFTDGFFQGAKFKNCNLENVDFSRADLRNANFEGANLSGADFENADLEGANFKNAINLNTAVFPSANLKDVKI